MKSNADFEQYCRDLDARFDVWVHTPPTTREDRIIRRNAWGHDMSFSFRSNRCAALDCRYPIKDVDNYYVASVGNVCDLCWAMYMAVKMRLFFIDAQREEDNIKKRKPGALGV